MDTKVRVDVKLQVGNVSESVDVVANTDKLQTDSVDLSRTISQHAVESLPSVGRNALNFLLVAPGWSRHQEGACMQTRTSLVMTTVTSQARSA